MSRAFSAREMRILWTTVLSAASELDFDVYPCRAEWNFILFSYMNRKYMRLNLL